MDTTKDFDLTLHEVAHIPLDKITADVARDLVRNVFDRSSEEPPVGVARFGSAI